MQLRQWLAVADEQEHLGQNIDFDHNYISKYLIQKTVPLFDIFIRHL
jgi:hypothetical protein